MEATEKTQEHEPYTPPAPQAEHAWLQRLVGEWDSEADLPPEAGGMTRGTESVRSLGDLWVLLEGRSEMGQTLMTLGYHPAKGRFVGSWVGSMMTWFWVYDGTLEGDTLSLESEGPDMTDPTKTARYKDVVRFVDEDTRTLTGNMQGPDGEWTPMMTATYRRRK